MKLSYNRKANNPIYYVAQSIRSGNKTTSFNVYKIGKHSDLLARGHQDPLAYAKEIVAKYNLSLAENKISYDIDVNFDEKVSLTKENIGLFEEKTLKNGKIKIVKSKTVSEY